MVISDVICVWCRRGPANLYCDADGAMQTICDECVDLSKWRRIVAEYLQERDWHGHHIVMRKIPE